jgi:hypothetical protein
MRGQAWSLAAATSGGEVVVGRWGGFRRLLASGVLLLALALVPVLASAGGELERPSAPTAPSEREILDRVATAPAGFVENVGQAHPSATHLAQGPGYAFAFGREGVRVSLSPSLSVGLEFVGANRNAEAVLAGRPSGGADYLVGERSRWRTGLAAYPELVYPELWPGVDMAFTGTKGRLKYEFRLAPGADPSRIQLAYQGAQSLSVGSAGALSVKTKQGVLKDAAPVSYQRIDGRRVPVESSFALGQGHGYGFALGAYDHSRPLVIDPGLEYSTYLGGAGNDSGFRIEVRGHHAFVTGGTGSPDFPVTANALDQTYNGGVPPTPSDAFVSRINTRKSGAASLEYSTFLGGTGNDFGVGIDVRGDDAYVTGQTDSSDFPVTADAYQSANAGAQDAFVVRLDTRRAGLAGLEYSTYLGGTSNDRGFEIDLKGDGAYLTGIVASPDFPVTANAYDQSFNGMLDVFVAQLDTRQAGTAGLRYSTFLGGSGQDGGRGIEVKQHDAYLTGPVSSTDFPVTANAYDGTFNGGAPPAPGGPPGAPPAAPTDAFVTRLDTRKPGSAGLEYSTYLGSSGNDEGFSMAVRRQNAFLTGVAGAPNFPVSPNAFDSTFAGGAPCAPPPNPFATCDAFVTRLDTRSAGAAGLEYSTFLGGDGGEIGRDITLRDDDTFIAGVTASANFPMADAYDDSFNGVQDAFVTRLDTGEVGQAALEYSTYLGGSNADEGFGIALKGSDAFIAGPTGSADFPTTANAFDTSFNGGGGFVPTDAFLSRLDTRSNGQNEDDD